MVRDYEKSFSMSITRQEGYAIFFTFRCMDGSTVTESGGRKSVQIKTVPATVSERTHGYVYDLLEIR